MSRSIAASIAFGRGFAMASFDSAGTGGGNGGSIFGASGVAVSGAAEGGGEPGASVDGPLSDAAAMASALWASAPIRPGWGALSLAAIVPIWEKSIAGIALRFALRTVSNGLSALSPHV